MNFLVLKNIYAMNYYKVLFLGHILLENGLFEIAVCKSNEEFLQIQKLWLCCNVISMDIIEGNVVQYQANVKLNKFWMEEWKSVNAKKLNIYWTKFQFRLWVFWIFKANYNNLQLKFCIQ